MKGTKAQALPRWVDHILIPFLNLSVAMIVTGLVIVAVGENPFDSIKLLISGAMGSFRNWGYTLYYTTNFIFTGLAVGVAIQAGLFNIGGEGQVYIAGLGACLAGLTFGFLPSLIALPLAIMIAAGFGAAWAFIPAWLQARYNSHIVITTIMFNYLANSLMIYLLRNFFRPAGSMALESRSLDIAIPSFAQIMRVIGFQTRYNPPLNISLFIALLAAGAVWYLLWRTRLGFEMRTIGSNREAALYAGMNPPRIIIVTMLISGGLAGLMTVNEILGVQNRLVLEFVGGAGFVGIAVALMGRAHPLGIVVAALLFGIFYQGGTELSFARPAINKDMIIVIQGLVILFMGALESNFRPFFMRLIPMRRADERSPERGAKESRADERSPERGAKESRADERSPERGAKESRADERSPERA